MSRRRTLLDFFEPSKRKKTDTTDAHSPECNESLPTSTEGASCSKSDNLLEVDSFSDTVGPAKNVDAVNIFSENEPTNSNTDTSLQMVVSTDADNYASTSSSQQQPSTSTAIVPVNNDIGFYKIESIHSIDDFTKKILLENPWTPPPDYIFPFSSRMLKGKETKNYVRRTHLESYKDWLILSDMKKGLFCKYCPLFTSHHEGGFQKNVHLGTLVSKPLLNFKNLTGIHGDLENHSRLQYHKDAVERGNNFLKNYNSNLNVYKQVNLDHAVKAKENFERLIPIVKTIILCGRQNISLRGHRDDGQLLLDSPVNRNEGNFRALLRFRVEAGDKTLESHLKKASSRATYISKTTQNMLIECCRLEILDRILKRVQQANFYSVMFDEASDSSGKAQISLVLRYVDIPEESPEAACIHEDFVTFIDAFGELASKMESDSRVDIDDDSEDLSDNDSPINEELSLTGVALSGLVLKEMKSFNLQLENCVGVGTDGCSVMLGNIGAVRNIQKEAKNALMTPCYSHKLNLSLSSSSKIQIIENASAIMKEITFFFKDDFPKRNIVLTKVLGHKLAKLCETRWVERHDSVLQFTEDLPDIIKTFTKISQWKNPSVSKTKAMVFISALCSSQFLVGLYCLSDILTLTLPLSKILQRKAMDLSNASDLVESVIKILETRRRDASDHFNTIYTSIEDMAQKLQVEIQKPRTCRRQTQRANYDIDDCKDYYRVTAYIPLIDQVLEDLKTRFTPEVLRAFQLSKLIPKKIIECENEDKKTLAAALIEQFGNLLKTPTSIINEMTLLAEIDHWMNRCVKMEKDKLESDAIEALKSCNKVIYPTIYKLLQILCTLPVTNATAERSFSSLRLLKTWLRTTMSQERLTGLALLHCHYDINIGPCDVIKRLAKVSAKNRLNITL